MCSRPLRSCCGLRGIEFSIEHILKPGYDFGDEFEFGLSVVLDGLARAIADPA